MRIQGFEERWLFAHDSGSRLLTVRYCVAYVVHDVRVRNKLDFDFVLVCLDRRFERFFGNWIIITVRHGWGDSLSSLCARYRCEAFHLIGRDRFAFEGVRGQTNKHAVALKPIRLEALIVRQWHHTAC